MRKADLEPVEIEDLVRFGEDRGRLEGLEIGRAEGERLALLAVLEARGLPLSEAQRRRIESEPSLERIGEWLRRAAVAGSADEVLGPTDVG